MNLNRIPVSDIPRVNDIFIGCLLVCEQCLRVLIHTSPRIAPRFYDAFVVAASVTRLVIFDDAETIVASVVSYVVFVYRTWEDMWSIVNEKPTQSIILHTPHLVQGCCAVPVVESV